MNTYFEVWECPNCGQAEKFNQPQMWVEHDCIGRDGTERSHKVRFVKVGPEEVLENE